MLAGGALATARSNGARIRGRLYPRGDSAGFRDDARFERAKSLLDGFQFVTLGGYSRALATARNFRLLRQRGITIRKTVDVLIATACLDYGFELLHHDRDFDLMAEPLGLSIAQPV